MNNLTLIQSIQTGLQSVNKLPELKKIQCLQKDPEVITIFCNHFLSCVTSKHDCKRQTNSELIRDFAMITDEAFALLVLENIWEGWIKMDPLQFFANKNTEKQRKKVKTMIWRGVLD